jgi:hypothetical protein
MNITQLSVFLENKPGRLQHVLKVLADRAINIRTLTIAEVSDFGILRMIVNRPDEAYAALKAEHVTCSRTDVLAVALHHLLETFSKRQLNIEYMYAFTDRHDAHSIMIFRFDDSESAKVALGEEGYKIMTRSEIHGE